MNSRTTTSTACIRKSRRPLVIAALAIGLLPLTAATAGAAQDPGPRIPVVNTSASMSTVCALTRVGTQYVRCDDLTGNGVAAPGWVATGSAGAATELASPSAGAALLEWRRHGV